LIGIIWEKRKKEWEMQSKQKQIFGVNALGGGKY